MRRQRIALVLCVLFFITPKPALADAIDIYLTLAMRQRRIPGVALIVLKNGVIVKKQGYGFANLETDTPVTPDTVFELASLTKQFTAAAIMLLMEDGRVGLDEPISTYLDATPDSWRAVTVRHLLTHTAGLPGMAHGFQGFPATKMTYSTADLYALARKDRVEWAPGERWQYSDVGYFLLGKIIESASGLTYRDFLAQRIFTVLGMKATTVLDQRAIIKHRARGYTLLNGELVNIRRDAQLELASHAGIFSTVGDLAKWDAALNSDKLLKRSSLLLMWTPVTLNNGTTYPYGFGWELGEKRGHRIIGHTGLTGTEMTRFPNDGLTVIVLTNLGGSAEEPNVNSWGLTTKVAEFLVSDLAYRSVEDRDPAFTAVVKDLHAGGVQAWKKELFAPEFWTELEPDLAQVGGFLSPLGTLRTIDLVERKPDGEHQLYRYRLGYTARSIVVTVIRNTAGKIVKLAAQPE